MAYDDVLAERLRDLLAEEVPDASQRRMFGALVFMVGGNIATGVVGDDLLVRLPREEADAALARPGVRPFAGPKRVMSGFVLVDGETLDDDVLRTWVERGVAYAATLPPK